jgi:hypothetical protein
VTAPEFDILRSDDGYCISADEWPRKAEAARVLIGEEVDTPRDWRSILRIARELTGPTLLRAHRKGETENGVCGCEDDSWLCEMGSGRPVGRFWYFDGSYCSLEEAAYAYDPEEAS